MVYFSIDELCIKKRSKSDEELFFKINDVNGAIEYDWPFFSLELFVLLGFISISPPVTYKVKGFPMFCSSINSLGLNLTYDHFCTEQVVKVVEVNARAFRG